MAKGEEGCLLLITDDNLYVLVWQEKGQAYTIKGMTPDSMDILRYRVFLKKPKIGDKIVFLNAGAYTFSTDFCGLKKLAICTDPYN